MLFAVACMYCLLHLQILIDTTRLYILAGCTELSVNVWLLEIWKVFKKCDDKLETNEIFYFAGRFESLHAGLIFLSLSFLRITS